MNDTQNIRILGKFITTYLTNKNDFLEVTATDSDSYAENSDAYWLKIDGRNDINLHSTLGNLFYQGRASISMQYRTTRMKKMHSMSRTHLFAI